MQHPESEKLIQFYRDQIGLKMVETDEATAEFATSPVRLFVDQGDRPTFIFELLVPDLDEAHADLLAKGCQILRWEGRGKTCYVRDPFGFIFNVWEDRAAFES